MKNQFVHLGTLLVLACAQTWPAVNAAELSANANVTILPSITISETDEVDFGILAAQTGNCVMAGDGVLNGSIELCHGVAQLGKFRIHGDDNRSIDINFKALPSTKLQFLPLAKRAQSEKPLELGETEWAVGGELRISQIVHGPQRIEYQVTANYE